jgi:hypothetical protein
MALYLHREGKPVKFTVETLRQMAQIGELRQDEYVYDDTKKEWIGAALVAELVGAWDLEEDEATVAMELPPEFFADENAMLPTASEAAAEPEPAPPPAPAAPPPAPTGPPPTPSSPPPEPEPAIVLEPEPDPALVLEPKSEPARPQTPPAPMVPVQELPQRDDGGGGAGRGGNREHGKWINPFMTVVLMIVTCNFYGLVWTYKRLIEINVFLGREEIKPMFFFLGIICGPMFWVVLWKLCKALPEMGEVAGVKIEDRSIILLLLGVCFPYGFYFLAQQDLNKIWEAVGATPS